MRTQKQLANLKPIRKGQLSKEESKKRSSNGGKKSGVVRQEKKKLKEYLELALQLPNEETGEKNNIAIVKSLIKEASKGNVKAFEVIRDTIGEKPIDKVAEVDTEGNDKKQQPIVFNINPVKVDNKNE